MKKNRITSLLLAGCIALGASPVVFAADNANQAEKTISYQSPSAEEGIETIQIAVTYNQTEARKMLPLINEFRTGDEAWYWNEFNTRVECHDLKQVSYDYGLEKIAMQRAAEVALKKGHIRPNGKTSGSVVPEYEFKNFHGDRYDIYMAECINYGGLSANSALESLKETSQPYSGQGHRRDLLGVEENFVLGTYTALGIGHAVSNGIHYWVTVHGVPTGEAYTEPNDSLTTVNIDIKLSDTAVKSVTSAEEGLTVSEGQSVDLPSLNAVIRMNEAYAVTDDNVSVTPTWTVTDADKAQIVDGQLKGLQAGSTTITTTALGQSISVPVTVTKPCTHSYVNGICSKCGAEEPNCPLDKFTDVQKGQWYHDGLHYTLEKGLMSGTGADTFSPNDTMTRAMVAQILYSRAGSPKISEQSPFTDVPDSKWYAKAVTWAANNGVVSGIGNGLFGPENNVTREQLAVMIHSAAKKPSASGALDFADASSVSSWAKDAVIWAVNNGIISGSVENGKKVLNPQGSATRIQGAVMIMQFDKKVK